jgi:hypothetical protein
MYSITIPMLPVISKLNQQAIRNQEKINRKLGLQDSEVSIMEQAIQNMVMREKQLSEQVERDAESFKDIAKSKLERKLKNGVTAQTANKLEVDFKSSVSKKESRVEFLRNKIEELEAQKEIFLKTLDKKIEALEANIKREEEAIKISEDYFRPKIDRCYEERPLDVVYPASHFKRVQELKDLQSSIEMNKKLVLVMKAAEYDGKPKDKWDIREEELAKMREEAKKEGRQRALEEKEKEEAERQIAIAIKQKEREARENADEERWEKQKQSIVEEPTKKEKELTEEEKENFRLMLLALKETGDLEDEGVLENF